MINKKVDNRQNVIKFNDMNYPKLPRGANGKPTKKVVAVLLQVFLTYKDDLSKSFIDYDTLYYSKRKKNHNIRNYYRLPEGKLIVLLLLAKSIQNKKGPYVFTTVRRWTTQKELYYKNHLGKVFGIEVQ